MLSRLAMVIVAIVVGSAGTAAVGVVSAASGHSALFNATPTNPTAAEQAAVSYVNQHYPGNGTAKVLKVEHDTENGSAVVDVTVLAPNGHAYDVEVSQSTNSVLSVEMAGDQANLSGSTTDDSGGIDSQSSNNSGSDQNSTDSGNSNQNSNTGTDS